MQFLIPACSVCFGDPSSLMSRGTIRGVIFLLAVVGLVLSACAWTVFSWFKREKKLYAGDR